MKKKRKLKRKKRLCALYMNRMLLLIRLNKLTGGVALGSVCNLMIGPHGAILIGIIAGLLSVAGYRYLTVRISLYSFALRTTYYNGYHIVK